MKILTIAIPTYNREKDLSVCLNSIFSQKDINYDDIEFLVSDNNSTDNTELLIKKFIKKGLPIRYIRNEKNIGPDNNFVQCFNLAIGRYFWLIGDDDIVLDGAISRILRLLKSNEEYGVVFLNSYPFVKNYEKEMPSMIKDSFTVYTSIPDFLSKSSYYLTFISTAVINKDISIKGIDIENMRKTNLIQLSWTFNAVFNSNKNAFIEYYCISAKSGARGGYKLCSVFGNNLQKVFDIYIGKGINPEYFEIIKKKMLMTFFPANIIRAKKQFFKGEKENYFKTLYPLYKNYLYFWMFTIPAIVLPVYLAYPLYKIVDLLRKLRRNFSV